ncbi:hypothetical protein [Bosea sp. RAC05]|uniref:hypothetical protein n=1 Tax=Bosea sp. RAC05 TaxID=1842539 RepID=UPI00083DAF04|nr:hypothetical protein [Bosea sp. RAC05]
MNDDSRLNETETRRPRRRVSLRLPPMPRVNIGRWVGDDARPVRGLQTNSDVSRFLLKRSLADLGGQAIAGPDPVTDERIARMMAFETYHAVMRQGTKNALTWYSDALRRAELLAGILHPELINDGAAAALGHCAIRTSEQARTVLFSAMAITSQNNTVQENMRYAIEQYRGFLAHGRFIPKGYGAKGLSIFNNLGRFNQLLDVVDGDLDRLRAFFLSKFKMSELRAAGANNGMRISGVELADETVYGSMVFGPKIGGAFLASLLGAKDVPTFDMWFTRTFGRYTGRLMKASVSDVQKERLSRSLDANPMAAVMAEEGFRIAGSDIPDLVDEDLLNLCRDLANCWERNRRALARAGYDNPSLSKLKSELDWPGAAESIVKSLGSSVDAPGSGGERRWIRSVVTRALEILHGNGLDLDATTLQAVLWYEEKAAWDHLAGRKVGELNVSYDEAMADMAKREGADHDRIQAILDADLDVGSQRDRVPAHAGRGRPRAGEGLSVGAGDARRDAGEVAELAGRRDEDELIDEDLACPSF